MKQAVLEAPRRIALVERPVPEPAAGEVLVRVAACGVCTSELDVWEGKAGTAGLPRAIGHEASGIVAGLGPGVEGLRDGDPVAVFAGSAFGEYVVAAAGNCFPAGDVPLDLALGEPLSCAVNAVELADIRLGDDVILIGAGFMGNLVQLLVNLRGPHQVIVADTRPDALERAARLGATRTVDVTRESLREIVRELTNGRGADVSIEATGAQAALVALGETTRMSGTVVIVGYHQGGERSLPLAHWNHQAFRIVNAHFRDPAVILHGGRIGMRLLTSGRLDLAPLVTHRFPLAEIDRAFQTAHEKPPGFAKATVVMDEALGVRR